MRRARGYFAISMMAILAGIPAPAIAQTTQFYGGGFFRPINQNCPSYGTSPTEFLFRARPAGMPGNHPTRTRMSFIMGTYAHHFDVDGATFESGNWTVPVVTAHVGGSASYQTTQTAGNSIGTSLRTRRIPNGTGLGEDEGLFILEVRDFDFQPGCLMRFAFAVTHRP